MTIPRLFSETHPILCTLLAAGIALVPTVPFGSPSCTATEAPVPAKLSQNAVRSCGPLTLVKALSLLGCSAEADRCAALAGTDANGVTTLAGLLKAAKALGQRAAAMNLTPRELSLVNRPAILHVSMPHVADHFLVFAFSDGRSFELTDPGHKTLTVPFSGKVIPSGKVP